MGGEWKNVPKCAECPCLQRVTTGRGKRPRVLICTHIEAKEAYQTYHGYPWPEKARGVTVGVLETRGEELPFKTAPRWCPLRPRWWARLAGGEKD